MIGSQVVPQHDIYITTFTCGCLWRWWTGKVGPQNHRWERQCAYHAAQDRPTREFAGITDVCTCLNVGRDDGATTCWIHHDCMDGSCTHME